ncbi:MAG: TIGR00295 family protein [Candidatus Bathyarchaeia archaeon]
MLTAGCSDAVIRHTKNVTKLALKIAEKFGEKGYVVDLELVEIGGLLHDLGRSKTHSVEHGALGGKMAREMGLPESLARIIDRHVGAGIPNEEAEKLGLPTGEYMPETLEEKIVTYADKLIEGSDVVDIDVTLHNFKESLGEDHPAIRRLLQLHREITCKIGSISGIDLNR